MLCMVYRVVPAFRSPLSFVAVLVFDPQISGFPENIQNPWVLGEGTIASTKFRRVFTTHAMNVMQD